MNLLKEKKMDDRVSVFVGGTIPPEDTDMLKKIGVSGVFLPGTALSQICDQIKKTVSVVRERQGLA
jgi:methylmalonyl-CoA mutase C-terminal domain/subunit